MSAVPRAAQVAHAPRVRWREQVEACLDDADVVRAPHPARRRREARTRCPLLVVRAAVLFLRIGTVVGSWCRLGLLPTNGDDPVIERRGFHLFVTHALELAVVSVLQSVAVAAEVLIVGR